MRGNVCAGIVLAGLLAGCATVTVKHEVAPIYASIDVNIRIQQALEQVFDFEKSRSVVTELPQDAAMKGGAVQ